MAIRTILHYPDKRLRDKAVPVTVVDDEIRRLVDDMAETMYDAPGVGLAATQIGVARRVFVIDIAAKDEPSEFRAFINPEIIAKDGEVTWEEGCLSFPTVNEEIKRAEQVTVRALGVDGKPFELAADGLLAVAIQHELDHLDGVLMIDRVSMLKKKMINRKMEKRAARRSDRGSSGDEASS